MSNTIESKLDEILLAVRGEPKYKTVALTLLRFMTETGTISQFVNWCNVMEYAAELRDQDIEITLDWVLSLSTRKERP